MKFANLHLHTVYSDGVLTPNEIFEKGKAMGYKALAITDHNTVGGHKAFKEAAKKHGMEYILGMEANGASDRYNFHIVGYDFDVSHPKMAKYLKYHNDIMTVIAKAKFDALIKIGDIKGITWQNVLDDAPNTCYMCNEHIFASLVKRAGYSQGDYKEYFLKFKSIKTDAPKIQYCSPKEMIGIIREAGGIASLAHPHKITHFLSELYSYGLNCVEYDHPDIDSEDIKEVLDFAKKNKIYLSGGTDHTGQLSNFPELRAKDPNDRDACFLVPLTTDVRNGVTKEEFYNLKNRIYG